MKTRVRSLAWTCAFAGLAAATSSAQKEDEPQTGTAAPEVVVIGTIEAEGVPVVPFDSVGSRDVLGPEEVERIGARDLNDLVQYLPALSTRPYNGGEASAPSFSIRGLPDDGLTEYVLALIDGVPSNPLPYGWTAFSFFPLLTEQVWAVDLIRGGHSVRYSPNTVGGVLNFITPPIPEEPSFGGVSTFGENGYASTLLSYGGGSGAFGYLLTVGDRRGDGYRDDGEFAQRTADVKLRWESGPDSWTAARLSYMEDEHQAPGGLTLLEFEQDRFGNARPENRFDGFRWVADAVHHVGGADGHVETFAWLSQTRRELEARRPHFGVPTDFQRWTDDSYVAAAGLRGENRELFGGDHTVYWGARVQQELLPSWEITGEPFGGGAPTVLRDSEYESTALSAHVDDTFEPTEGLKITAGVRGEWIPIAEGEDDVLGGDFDDDFAALLPGVGASYEITEQWVLFGNYQQSFRAPQVWGYDLSAGAASQDVGFERGDSFELGTRVLGPGGIEASVTGWRTDFDDVGVFYTGVYENIGRIVSEGVDFGLAWEAGAALEDLDGLSLHASWTIQDSELREGPNAGNESPYAWENKAAWSLQYLTRSDWRFALGGVYVGESFSDEANTTLPSPDGTLGINHSRTIWDAQVEKQCALGDGMLSFALGATNVFDRECERELSRCSRSGSWRPAPRSRPKMSSAIPRAARCGSRPRRTGTPRS
jgi:Fe(3+) dicitrate transport protein